MDIIVFTPTVVGANTSGIFGPGLFFDGAAHGLNGEDLNGIALGD